MHKQLGQIVFWASVWGWLCCARGVAQAPLPVLAASPKQLRVDGDLGEWRGARFVRLGDEASGRAEIALAYDERGLYLGARVHDDVFVRTAHPSPREDALVFRLALPNAGRFETSELWLFAGRIGKSPASVQLATAQSKRPVPLRGSASIVEGPADGGYALEAFVPWSSVHHGEHWAFARGFVYLHDVDRGGRAARIVPQEAEGKSGERLPWLLFDGGAFESLRGFLQQKSLAAATPLLDWVGDVSGDSGVERVLLVGTYLVVVSSGKSFTFVDLPVAHAADLRAAEMRDLTGDGKPELLLRSRSPHEHGVREVWRVFDLRAATPQVVFGVETRLSVDASAFEADVAIDSQSAGRPAQVRVRARPAKDAVMADAPSAVAGGNIVAVPLPWGPWSERVYAWDGSRFALQKEVANPAQRAHSVASSTPAAPGEHSAQLAAVAQKPTAAVDTAALVKTYRQARGIAADAVPRFVQRADVAGDARLEELSLYGRELLVTGAGFRGGRDFFFFGLPAQVPGDVQRVFTGDVTGDGRAELLARVRQSIGDVTRELLFVYTFAGDSLTTLLSEEVRRSRGAHSIENQVALKPMDGHVVLHIAPGAARGWSASDYPFVSDARDGVAPLLLPWKDRPTRYDYDGHRFVSRVSND